MHFDFILYRKNVSCFVLMMFSYDNNLHVFVGALRSEMAAHVSTGNIHNFYLAGQVYRGQAFSWSSASTFMANPFKEPSWYHFF